MKNVKAVFYVFLLGLAVGILIPNIFPENAVKMNGLSDILLLQKYLGEPITGKDYFLYLLRQRGWGYVLGAVFGVSIFGVPMGLSWMFALGFYVGFLLTSTLLAGGLGGFLVGLGLLLPQYLVYVPASMLLFDFSFQMSVGCWRGNDYTWRDYRRYSLVMLGLIFLIVAGFALESFVNPALVKFLLERLKIF